MTTSGGYRKKRLAQLPSRKINLHLVRSPRIPRRSTSTPHHEDAVVVVHLHEPNYGPCRRLNGGARGTGGRRRDVRFLGLALGGGRALQGYDVETCDARSVPARRVVETCLSGLRHGPSYGDADVESPGHGGRPLRPTGVAAAAGAAV